MNKLRTSDSTKYCSKNRHLRKKNSKQTFAIDDKNTDAEITEEFADNSISPKNENDPVLKCDTNPHLIPPPEATPNKNFD